MKLYLYTGYDLLIEDFLNCKDYLTAEQAEVLRIMLSKMSEYELKFTNIFFEESIFPGHKLVLREGICNELMFPDEMMEEFLDSVEENIWKEGQEKHKEAFRCLLKSFNYIGGGEALQLHTLLERITYLKRFDVFDDEYTLFGGIFPKKY